MINNKRNFWKYILLTLITGGIYHWIFLHFLIKDVNVLCDGDGQTTPGLLKMLLLSLITFGIYGCYWLYKLGNRLAENAPRFHVQIKEKGITILLWILLGSLIYGLGLLVAWYLIIRNVNVLAGAYNYVYYGNSDCTYSAGSK